MNSVSTLFLKSFVISFASSVIIGYLSYKLGNVKKSTVNKNKKSTLNKNKKKKEMESKELHSYSVTPEEIQLMTGKFQSVSMKNWENFVGTLDVPPTKRLILGVGESCRNFTSFDYQS